MGKIAEKIIAKRLAISAEVTDLLYEDQIGGRKQRSAVDAVLSIIHDIQLNKHEKLKTSAIFMDIKGAFDHVFSNRIVEICIKLEMPKSFIL